MVKLAEPPKSTVKEAAATVGATAPPAAPKPLTDDERSLEQIGSAKELGAKIREKRTELAVAKQTAEAKKNRVKGLEVELDELHAELEELLTNPYKDTPLFAPKNEVKGSASVSATATPQMFVGRALDSNAKGVGTYHIKAFSRGDAHKALQGKCPAATGMQVEPMTKEHESLKLELLDATLDPAWRKRRVEELKLPGAIAGNLDTSILTVEALVRAYNSGKIGEKELTPVRDCLERFRAGLPAAQAADYTAFVASIPVGTKGGEKPETETPSAAADASPVRRGRASKRDRDIAQAVADTEANATTDEPRAEMVRRKWDATAPEARIDMMAKALTEEGRDYWCECQLANCNLSDEIRDKLAVAGFDTIGSLVSHCQDGRFLDRITGINKSKAVLISEALLKEWEGTLQEDPTWALPATPELQRTAS